MPILSVRQKKEKFSLPLPRKLWLNGQMVGIMQTPEVNIELPEGHYMLKIQSMFPFFSATQVIQVKPSVRNVVEFQNREKWWDILFTIDMIFWIAELFFTLPHPWDIVYKVVTNGYFAIWLIYEWVIREKYYRITTWTTPMG